MPHRQPREPPVDNVNAIPHQVSKTAAKPTPTRFEVEQDGKTNTCSRVDLWSARSPAAVHTKNTNRRTPNKRNAGPTNRPDIVLPWSQPQSYLEADVSRYNDPNPPREPMQGAFSTNQAIHHRSTLQKQRRRRKNVRAKYAQGRIGRVREVKLFNWALGFAITGGCTGYIPHQKP